MKRRYVRSLVYALLAAGMLCVFFVGLAHFDGERVRAERDHARALVELRQVVAAKMVASGALVGKNESYVVYLFGAHSGTSWDPPGRTLGWDLGHQDSGGSLFPLAIWLIVTFDADTVVDATISKAE